MIKVNFKSSILNLIQGTPKDKTYQAWQNAHNGISALQNAVQRLALLSETLTSGDGKTYGFKNIPAFIIVNGLINHEGDDYSIKNNFAVFFSTLPSGTQVRSYYLGQSK